MNIAFYTGRTGLRAYSDGINIAAQNITNSSTTGYKSTSADFRELVYNALDQNVNKGLSDDEKINQGHGVKIQNDSLNYTQGELSQTGYTLDFAIEGDALFAVDRYGQTEYTRDGTFDLSVEDDGCYLVASDGSYVMDDNYQRITVPYDADTKEIDTESLRQTIGIFRFDNPYGLEKTDGQGFLATDISGTAEVASRAENTIMQGFLERSNTSLAKEMSDVIVIQKAYSFSAKVVQTADEIEDIVNNLRR